MKPFVHKFRTAKYCYIYDVNTNRVFRVKETTFELIDQQKLDDPKTLKYHYPQYSMELIEGSLLEILDARKKGFNSSHRPKKMVFGNGTPIEDLCSISKHQHLILNVTEKCNLRCSYCVYSGKYTGKRTHSEKQMSLETAKKAVDKFLERASDRCSISFYGGECLLNFRLIKSITDYVTERSTKEVNWSMTTNGTLLTPEICAYLVKRGFILNISLDGPKHIHDRYRIFKDGTGTFDIIIKNLDYMNANYPDYYMNNVMFLVVNAPPFNLKEVEIFFREDPLFKRNIVNLNYIKYNIKDFYKATCEDHNKYNEDLEELMNAFCHKISNGNEGSSIIRSRYEKDFLRFYHRPKTSLPDIIRPNGCCIPGERCIFVSIDGSLHVCEKMDDSYKIGDVDNWIEPLLVKELCDEYVSISQDCFTCWACRLCPRCFDSFVSNLRLDKETRLIKCHATRTHFHKVLIAYYSIYEQNKLALDYLQNMDEE
jgi:uncharacterized protein